MTTTAKIISMDDCRPTGAQLEDGYVRIANELYDAVLNSVHSLRHIKVVFALIRKTYGFNKKEDDITISQIAELACVHRNHVGRAIKDLEEMRVINPVRAGRYGLILGLNKRHDEWAKDEIKPRGQATKLVDSNQIGRSKQPNGCIEATKLVDLSNQNVAHKRQPQKTISKDNSKRIARSDERNERSGEAFALFWDAFGLKKGHKAARATFCRAFEEAGCSDAWLDAVVLGAKAEAARRPHLIAKGLTPLYAQGWISDKRFESEDLAAWGRFTDRQQAFVDAFNSNIGDMCAPVDEWSERRAALIDAALLHPWPIETWSRYWKRVSERCTFKGQVSFEWMVSWDNFVRVKDGEFGDLS